MVLRVVSVILTVLVATGRVNGEDGHDHEHGHDHGDHAEEPGVDRKACERSGPDCDPSELLSDLERRAVARVLKDDPNLVIEHSPHGKTISVVRIVTQRVFGPGDGFLRWFNKFHSTTRESAVRREFAIGAGDVWDQRRVDEAARRLRDPASNSLVAVLPLQAPDGRIEVLVVTRDVWSLRANSSWEIQDDKLTFLDLAIAENNLFGRRRLLALAFRMDQGAYFIGPRYADKNIAGRHIDIHWHAGPLFNRQTSAFEGSESDVELARPLWSLDTRWGAAMVWFHRDEISRAFVGNELKGYVCDAGACRAATGADDPAAIVPHVFGLRNISLDTSVVRAFGNDDLQQRVRGGYELSVQRPTLPDDFPDDPMIEEAFANDVMPRSERTSAVFVGAELIQPRYRRVLDLETFALGEDVRTGVIVDVKAGAALRLIGSQSNFVRLSGSAGYTGVIGDDGVWSVNTAVSTRIEGGRAIDTKVEGTARLATPNFPVGRVVTQVQVAGLFRDSQNEFFTLGGSDGLRGFAVNAFDGDRRVVWNFELRTRPVPILFTRWGLVAFNDLGGTSQTFGELEVHHDVGLGLRTLMPQLAPEVFRFDFAFPLDGPQRGELRFSAGYEQGF